MYELTVYWDEGRDSLLNAKRFTLVDLKQLRLEAIGFSLMVRVYSHPSSGDLPVLIAEFCGPRVQYTLAQKI